MGFRSNRRFLFTMFSAIIFVIIHHATGKVQFYKDVDFKGPLDYNLTVEDWHFDPPTAICAVFEPQHGYPLSLETTECLVVFERGDCVTARDSHITRYLFNARIPPGDYPNLTKFLHNLYFPCAPKSFRTCVEFDRLYGDGNNATVELLDGSYYEDHTLLTMKNVCGCLNLPKWTYGRVRAIVSWQYCFTLFSEPHCQGKFVKIPPGLSDASADLRRLSFKGLAKSLNTCKKIHSCHDRHGTGIITGYSYDTPYGRTFNIPLSHLEDEKFVDESLSFSSGVSSPRNASCENSVNSTCSNTCGGVLQYTERGAITYKPTESLESFERCVWIIRPYSNKSRVDVNLIWSGFKHIRGKVELLVSGYDMEENRFSTERLNDTENRLLIDAPLLLITLYTDELETGLDYKGFMLEYKAVLDSPDYFVSPFSFDYNLEFGESLRFPPSTPMGGVLRSTYSNYELSTFLFHRNHKDELRLGSKQYFIDISQISLGVRRGICFDHIMVHYFRNDDWMNQGYRMHAWEDPQHISNDDMILLVFKSYSMTTGQGFYLNSSVEDSVVCHVTYPSFRRMENGWKRLQ